MVRKKGNHSLGVAVNVYLIPLLSYQNPDNIAASRLKKGLNLFHSIENNFN